MEDKGPWDYVIAIGMGVLASLARMLSGSDIRHVNWGRITSELIAAGVVSAIALPIFEQKLGLSGGLLGSATGLIGAAGATAVLPILGKLSGIPVIAELTKGTHPEPKKEQDKPKEE